MILLHLFGRAPQANKLVRFKRNAKAKGFCSLYQKHLSLYH